MATFTDKVQALVGSDTATASMDLAVMEAATQVFGDLGDSTIEHMANREKIPPDGLPLDGRILGGVVTETGRAFQIDPSRKESFRYGERTRPVYFVDEGTVHTQPERATCWALLLEPPTSTTEAENRDPQFQILLALQTAQHLLQEEMAEVQRGILDVGTLPDVPPAPSEPSFTYAKPTEISPTATTISDFPTAPSFEKVNVTADFADFQSYFDVEDTEMGQQALSQVQTDLQEAQTKIQDEQARVEAELTEYQSQVEKAIQQAQISVQEAQQTAQNAQEVEMRNAAKTLEAEVQEYQSKLQQHQSDVQRVTTEMEKVFREAEIDTQQRSKRLEMMGFDMQRLRSRYRRQLKTYRKLNRAKTGYRIVSSGY